MDKKSICGVYNIIANITDCFNSSGILLANSGRNVNVNAAHGNKLSFNLVSNGTYSEYVRFIKQNVLKIKKARLITVGAEGLRAGNAYTMAASIMLEPRKEDDQSGTSNNFCVLKFPRFNEWTEFNIDLNLWQNSTITGDVVHLGLVSQMSDIHFDDYNIQSAYVGERFKLSLEMIVDTAGMIKWNGGII